MSRDVAAEIIEAMRREQSTRIFLVQFATGNPSTPYLRYTSRDVVTSFAGLVWTPRPIEVDITTLDSQTETAGPKVRTMDLDNVFGALISAGYDFSFKRVRIVRTTEEGIASTLAGWRGVVDDWFVDFYERVGGAISFSLRPMLAVFSTKVPLRTISRAAFPGIPDPD